MPTSEVVQIMRAFKADIARAGSQQQAAMARRWLAVERRLMGQMEALAYRMTAVHEAGGVVTTNMLMTEVRYQELLIQLHEEQAKYTVYAERTITNGQQAMASAGVSQSQAAIAAQVSTSFNRLPVSAVEHMVGLTGAGTPLNSLLVQSWPLSAQGLTQALVDGVALGYNPRKVARQMAEGMTGTLNRMMVIARTEQLRVYRESSLASYKESGIVVGYRRLATHDRRTCAACIMAEGTFYALDEEMPEHPQGRCSMIPVVRGASPIEWQHGQDWFMEQPSETQESILGKGHYEAWRLGKFDLGEVVTVKPNSTWGDSLAVTPLRDLT
jgi:SPP1 gp7 family putative phage head morphogenesis protein